MIRNFVSTAREYERGTEWVASPGYKTVPRILKLSVAKISLMVFVILSRKYFFDNFQFFSLFNSRSTEMKYITLNPIVDLEFFLNQSFPLVKATSLSDIYVR